MIRYTWFRLRNLRCRVRQVLGKNANFTWYRTFHRIFTGPSLAFCLIPAVNALEIPNMDDYAMSKLLQNSSVASAEAASTFLTYVTVALYNAEKEYVQGLNALMKLIEFRLENQGHPEQDKMEELIVETRINVKSLKKKRQDLLMLLSVCQRLVNDAAEAAYMAGADFSGYTTNNKLSNCESFLKPCELERVLAETNLAELEARVIEVESKRAKEEEEAESKEDVTESVNSGSSAEVVEESLEQSTEKEAGDIPDSSSVLTQTTSSESNVELHLEYVETCTFDTGSQGDLFDDD